MTKQDSGVGDWSRDPGTFVRLFQMYPPLVLFYPRAESDIILLKSTGHSGRESVFRGLASVSAE